MFGIQNAAIVITEAKSDFRAQKGLKTKNVSVTDIKRKWCKFVLDIGKARICLVLSKVTIYHLKMHQIVSKMMFLFLAPPTGNGTFLRRSPLK